MERRSSSNRNTSSFSLDFHLSGVGDWCNHPQATVLMPALVLFNQRLGIGGDDLAVPSLLSSALHGIWVLALIVAYLYVKADEGGDCDVTTSSNDIVSSTRLYVATAVAVFSLIVVMDVLIYAVATRGTIVCTEPRKSLGTLILVRSVLVLFQLCLCIVGFWLATEKNGCPPMNVILVTSISQLVDFVAYLCCCIMVVGEHAGYSNCLTASCQSPPEYERLPSDQAEKLWADKCRRLLSMAACATCGAFGGGKSAQEADFSHLSRVIARIFDTQEFLDIVPSDIAAGLVLQHCARKRKEADLVYIYIYI